MKFGCIGGSLKHSYSKQIHNRIGDDYELIELTHEEVAAFMEAKDFQAINVTIPYKETVIGYLDEIDKDAESIGAVNTVINKDGKLYGYNTDFYGLSMLASHAGIDFYDKKVLVLGTGGTSKTAVNVAGTMGAKEIIVVSRKKANGVINYDEAMKYHRDADIIINATPIGMFPKILGKPIEISKFRNLQGVLDVVYNPLTTPLVLEAQKYGIKAEGGLYMLVAQAVRASEMFHGKKHPDGLLDKIYKEIEKENQNIVLIGMPSCGKSTIGAMIAEKLNREFMDTDDMIAQRTGTEPAKILESRGEETFRDIESTVLLSAAPRNGIVVATGGGIVLRAENMAALRENGRIYFIDRDVDKLTATEDRPLSATKEALEAMYKDRVYLYNKHSHVRVDGNGTPEEVCDLIIKDFLGK